MNPVAPVTKYFTFSSSLALRVLPGLASRRERYARSLNECRAAFHEVLEQALLNRLAHLLGDLEHGGAVVGRLGAIPGEGDRRAKLDSPLRRERHRPECTQRRERGRDREVGCAEQLREQA